LSQIATVYGSIDVGVYYQEHNDGDGGALNLMDAILVCLFSHGSIYIRL